MYPQQFLNGLIPSIPRTTDGDAGDAGDVAFSFDYFSDTEPMVRHQNFGVHIDAKSKDEIGRLVSIVIP